MEELVILVDANDNEIGVLEKIAAHQLGLLHRALSVFIFNEKDELLLQQRADEKYHSPSLWSNTCCSHPRPNETVENAVIRRMKEEMGLQCATEFAFSFIYNSNLENGLIEHEFDHVYFGRFSGEPILNLNEAKSYKYIDLNILQKDIMSSPENYTEWIKICLPQVILTLNSSLFRQ